MRSYVLAGYFAHAKLRLFPCLETKITRKADANGNNYNKTILRIGTKWQASASKTRLCVKQILKHLNPKTFARNFLSFSFEKPKLGLFKRKRDTVLVSMQ